MSPRAACALLALLLGAAPLACGRKSAPRPPEDVVPASITDLTATNAAGGIQLSWSRPARYADGSRMTDLAGFVIARSQGDLSPTPMQQIADLAVSDRDRFRQLKRFRYVDPDTIVGIAYRYQVVSYTLDGYFSASSNSVLIQRAPVGEKSNAPLPTPER